MVLNRRGKIDQFFQSPFKEKIKIDLYEFILSHFIRFLVIIVMIIII